MKKKNLILLIIMLVLFMVSCENINRPSTSTIIGSTNGSNNVISVEFNSNGGSLIDDIILDSPGLIDAPLFPKKQGYVFRGWYLDEELTDFWDFETQNVSSKLTLYAKWVESDKTYYDSFKVLSIGNSFSEDAHRYLWSIAKSAGIPEENIIIANMYIGGAELNHHVTNLNNDNASYILQKYTGINYDAIHNQKLSTVITLEDWDVITFQQASHQSGMTYYYQNYINTLSHWVLQNATNPAVKIGWHMTWAYEQTSTHNGFGSYNKDQMKMYEMIVNATEKKVLSTLGLGLLIPSGTAIQNARTSYFGDTFTRDGYHLSDPFGRYIASLTFFGAITGIDLDDVVFVPHNLNLKEKIVAIESAKNALLNPLNITTSQYEEDDFEDTTHTDEPIYFVSGYWNTNSNSIIPGNDEFSQSFIASNILSKEFFEDYHSLHINLGYKVRVIFLSYIDGVYKVESRSNNLTGTINFNDIPNFRSYEYIAFNLTADDSSNISNKITEVASQLSFLE